MKSSTSSNKPGGSVSVRPGSRGPAAAAEAGDPAPEQVPPFEGLLAGLGISPRPAGRRSSSALSVASRCSVPRWSG